MTVSLLLSGYSGWHYCGGVHPATCVLPQTMVLGRPWTASLSVPTITCPWICRSVGSCSALSAEPPSHVLSLPRARLSPLCTTWPSLESPFCCCWSGTSMSKAVISKANRRHYFLVVLKRAAFQTDHLLHFSVTFIRPNIEYVALVWHLDLTKHLWSARVCAVPVSMLYTPGPILQTGAGGHRPAKALGHGAQAECAWTLPPQLAGLWTSTTGFLLSGEHAIIMSFDNNDSVTIPHCRPRHVHNGPIMYCCEFLNGDF